MNKDKFYEKCHRPDVGCWLWTAGNGAHGYGVVRYNGKAISAHRASYLLHCGEIPSGMCVCHTCDNRKCVNPSHLFIGSIQENMDDRNRKMRQAHGVRHSSALLNDEVVRIIRIASSSGKRSKELAPRFGVHHTTINDIVSRRTWRHVA